ncbi:MAG: acetolactate decarboxylase [Myxococcota bacterium]
MWQVGLSAGVLVVALVGCEGVKPWGGAADTVHQVSTLELLLSGAFDGVATVSEVRQHGDFGLGTYDRLDGEMVVLDGTVYQVHGDGSVKVAPMHETTPYAMVTKFVPDVQFRVPEPMTLTALEAKLDGRLDDLNAFHAIRVDGVLPKATVRSIHAQAEPYADAETLSGTHPTWNLENITGTLVGVRSPSFVGTMAPAGYHWHFISDDRTLGGHILAAEVGPSLVRVNHNRNWDVRLPMG